jgi:predicted CoA-binding protein
MPLVATAAGIRAVLERCRTIAVVGLSDQWHRPSFFAASYMQHQGWRIVPVNPRLAGQRILGEAVFATLEDIPHAIDMVDVFRKPDDVPPIADSAIAIGAKCLWLQLGVVHEGAAARTVAAGLDVVMDRCVKIEHARLFGGLSWVGVNTGVVSAQRRRRA